MQSLMPQKDFYGRVFLFCHSILHVLFLLGYCVRSLTVSGTESSVLRIVKGCCGCSEGWVLLRCRIYWLLSAITLLFQHSLTSTVASWKKEKQLFCLPGAVQVSDFLVYFLYITIQHFRRRYVSSVDMSRNFVCVFACLHVCTEQEFFLEMNSFTLN